MKQVTLFEVVEREVIVGEFDEYFYRYSREPPRFVPNVDATTSVVITEEYIPIHKVYRYYGKERYLVAFDPKFKEIFEAPFIAAADQRICDVEQKSKKAIALAERKSKKAIALAKEFWQRSLIMRLILAIEGPEHPLNRIQYPTEDTDHEL